GFVFQSYNLIASLPAWANVAMPLEFRGTPKKQREIAARKMLKAVNLANRMDHTPSEMSGGQQQRVGIARAFVHHPKLVFADEPTGNLDSKTTIEVMELMVSMAQRHRQTLIIVTHDPEIADYADRIIHLIDGKIHSDCKNNPRFTVES
ncbi:MAG: ATP-binding cassette domain-containing protein, partial [Bacillota bacterium]|nr:ATP-binding cassette domain-containing protein [Bacillota bacterium]